MSFIRTMEIMGIRSFSPEDDTNGVIHFLRPLTLILGKNGTGKTTIIECLKYATTGQLPPNCQKNASFIHDPKVAQTSEVKAKVNLRFTDCRGETNIVSRRLTAKQTAKQTVMQTNEGFIKKEDGKGGFITVSSKCVDLNKELIEKLGVSRPILENVIFCHQEDSNWPLSEGKVLKSKFDDIFASTRYVKALDSYRAVRKQKGEEVKNLATVCKFEGENRKQSAKFQREYDDQLLKFNSLKNDIDDLKKIVEPKDKILLELLNSEDELQQMHDMRERLKTERNEIMKSIVELESQVGEVYKGNLSDLRVEISEFESKLRELEDRLEDDKRVATRLVSKVNEASERKSKLLVNRGKLDQEAKVHERNLTLLHCMVVKLTEEYGIVGGSNQSCALDLERRYSSLREEARVNRAKFDDKLMLVDRELEEKRDKKMEIETQLNMKKDQLKKNCEEMKRMSERLEQVKSRVRKLADLRERLSLREQELTHLEAVRNEEADRAQIGKLGRLKDEMEPQMEALNDELERLAEQSSSRAQMDVLVKDLAKKKLELQRLEAKNNDKLMGLIGKIPAANFKRTVDHHLHGLSEQIAQKQQSLQKHRLQKSIAESERKNTREEITKKEAEAKQMEEEILNFCELEQFDDELELLKRQIEENSENKAHHEGSLHSFKKYIDLLKKQRPPCPLCHRHFEEQQQVDELIAELEDERRKIPMLMQKVQKQLLGQERRRESMLQLKPTKERMEGLLCVEIPQLKKQVSLKTKVIAELAEEVGSLEEELALLTAEEFQGKALLADMSFIDKYHSEIRNLSDGINSSSSANLSGLDPTRSIASVNEERSKLQKKMKETCDDLEGLRLKVSEHQRKLQALRSGVYELKNEIMGIERDTQDQQIFMEQRAALQEANKKIAQDRGALNHELEPLQDQLNRLEKEKSSCQRDKEAQSERDRNRLSVLEGQQRELQVVQSEVEAYEDADKQADLEMLQRQMDEAEHEIERLKQQQQDSQNNVMILEKKLGTQQTHQRYLDDNLKIRMKGKEVKDREAKIGELALKMGNVDVQQMQRQKHQLQRELSSLREEILKGEVRRESSKEQMGKLEESLADGVYKNAAKNYAEVVIKLKTTELVCADLDKYYHALDHTINSFHHRKMEEINKVLLELWQDTYTGSDIDAIEIRSSEDEMSSASRRRSFNYRVVMVRGAAVMDMRGRCSAGQKVLASLLIRLALAETFSLNCNVLALDEPTTNLDQTNINNLAAALRRIIENRFRPNNFQLIVITHDADFIDHLGPRDGTYIQVSKTLRGHSRLARCNIADIQD